MLCVYASSARAAWTNVASPVLPNQRTMQVNAVSCIGFSFCLGVGKMTNDDGQWGSSQLWNGSTWTNNYTSRLAGTTVPELRDVACPTSSQCMSVGSYRDATGVQVAAANRISTSGTGTWGALPMPTGGTAAQLEGVSCIGSMTNCNAVGWYQASTGRNPFGAHWDGTTWTLQTVPTPTGGSQARLNGMQCLSATSCFAVGSYVTGGVSQTLFETWDGTSWTAQSSANSSATVANELLDISCTSATACTAVGDTGSGTTQHGLAERYNGTTWTLQTVPEPSGATVSTLQDVSCYAATSCIAIGSYAGSVRLGLSEGWNGTVWKAVPTPNPGLTSSSQLLGIDCPSTTACRASGTYTSTAGIGYALTDHDDPSQGAWTNVASPVLANQRTMQVNGVSCIGSSFCLGVGKETDTNGQWGSSQVWNGSTWSNSYTSRLVNTTVPELRDVTCPSTSLCMSVGSYKDATGVQVAASNRITPSPAPSGTGSWAAVPMPTGGTAAQLEGVACIASTADCDAVGWYQDPSGRNPFGAHWDGTAWTLQTVPTPAGGSQARLSSIKCFNSASCFAVGSYVTGGVSQTLFETWDGTSWTVQSSANSSATVANELLDISCTSATACTAVGDYGTGTSQHGLAERYNGTTWTLQTVPDVSGATSSSLSSVSCTAATVCDAAGSYTNASSTRFAAASVWNGTTWSTSATPNPGLTTTSQLFAIDCPSTNLCRAGGTYTATAGIGYALTDHKEWF